MQLKIKLPDCQIFVNLVAGLGSSMARLRKILKIFLKQFARLYFCSGVAGRLSPAGMEGWCGGGTSPPSKPGNQAWLWCE